MKFLRRIAPKLFPRPTRAELLVMLDAIEWWNGGIEDQIKKVRADNERLKAENAKIQAELEAFKSGMAAAAGELLVSIPPPGSDAEKLLHANVMMRKYRIPELQAEIDRLIRKEFGR